MAVDIKKSNKDFSDKFNHIKNELDALLGSRLPVYHVGSTAVPGIDGKNILDVLISAKNSQDKNRIKEQLVEAGYFPSLNPSDRSGYMFLASRQEETSEGDVHIHIAITDTETHNNFLIIRDYLRSSHDEALKYSKAKYIYAKKAGYNRPKYKKYKSEYVSGLLQRAKDWHNHQAL